MGRSTRSAVGSALSDKTSVAGTNASPPAPQETTPTQQPPKRSSRRLAINNTLAPPSIDSPSNAPKLVKSDTNRAYVATTATAPPTHRRGRNSATSATRKDGEDAPTEGDLNEKENRPPTTSHQTRTRSRKSRSIDRESTIIPLGDVTETAESVEKQEPRLILATQTDNKPSIEPVTETTIKILPAEVSSIDASRQKERGQQQQKQHVSEDSGVSPAVTQEKRKWARRTKVVKLEDVTSPVPTPMDSRASEEGESDEEEEENEPSDSEDSDGEYGKTSKRLKVEKSVPLFKSTPESELSEYERQRLENIRRNQEMLMSLELPTAVTQLQIATMEGMPSQKERTSADDLFKDTPKSVRISKQREWKTSPKIVKPIRVSNRIRGVAVTLTLIGENDKLEHGSSSHNDQRNIHNQETDTSNVDGTEGEDVEDMASLMSGDLFFDKATRERAIRVDGHYHGWLDPGVIERYGFETNAKDAWEANGGGSFSFKDPLGLQSDTAGTSRSKTAKRPKHEAKMVAKGLFKKNPNAFFYRHNEPGQEQWTGDWTAEEQEIFLKVAAEHGCGDKWGLFASHIPHRVGYQCSNFYRQVVLPEGMVFDPNYEYTSRGKPIYCGKHNQWRK
ncbi:hypothetical protein KI688_008991 [Linnemannia hyalina]|uniref:Myb-like domain-containing protein n=1 Tax=Linnemannia hyalina TaxID=64524 RepID=A0A9P8BUR7_9FUNG|nr:hypothetical protein KI688_008991 [Linnemannia hyalina]